MMYFLKGLRVQNELFLCLGVGGGEGCLQEMSILGLGGEKSVNRPILILEFRPQDESLGNNYRVCGVIPLSLMLRSIV